PAHYCSAARLCRSSAGKNAGSLAHPDASRPGARAPLPGRWHKKSRGFSGHFNDRPVPSQRSDRVLAGLRNGEGLVSDVSHKVCPLSTRSLRLQGGTAVRTQEALRPVLALQNFTYATNSSNRALLYFMYARTTRHRGCGRLVQDHGGGAVEPRMSQRAPRLGGIHEP